MNLKVNIGTLTLQNPVMVASGTFGYAKEMLPVFDLAQIGAILPKTVTVTPRDGNPPLRTVMSASSVLWEPWRSNSQGHPVYYRALISSGN